MVLYLVKWEDGSAALVSAVNEEDLVDTLDQLADPYAASWVEFDGPLWIELAQVGHGLPPGDVDPFETETMAMTIPDTDHGGEFTDMLLRVLHPEFHKLRDAAAENEQAIARTDFDTAVAKDLVWALPGSTLGGAKGPEH